MEPVVVSSVVLSMVVDITLSVVVVNISGEVLVMAELVDVETAVVSNISVVTFVVGTVSAVLSTVVVVASIIVEVTGQAVVGDNVLTVSPPP